MDILGGGGGGGLCEAVSLCVRSLAGHLSARACRLDKEAVVECKEMLPLFLSSFAGREWK